MGKKRQLRRAELKRAERRKIMELRKQQRNRKIMMAVSVMLIGIISVVIVVSMSNSPNDYDKSNEPVQPPDVISETEVKIPLSDIGNNAKFYSYDADGVQVKYFAVKGSDGDVHVAFDACDVCYREKKGYSQKGKVMHCINCGREYPINSCGTENTAGGCWPSYLPMRIDEGYVIIEKSDLEQKKWMF